MVWEDRPHVTGACEKASSAWKATLGNFQLEVRFICTERGRNKLHTPTPVRLAFQCQGAEQKWQKVQAVPHFRVDPPQGNEAWGHCSLSPLRVASYSASCQAHCVSAATQLCPSPSANQQQHVCIRLESNRQGQKQYFTAFLSLKSSCFWPWTGSIFHSFIPSLEYEGKHTVLQLVTEPVEVSLRELNSCSQKHRNYLRWGSPLQDQHHTGCFPSESKHKVLIRSDWTTDFYKDTGLLALLFP